MEQNDKTTLLEFPCDFSLKIIGTSSDKFTKDVTAIILRHFPDTDIENNILPRKSDKGNYTAITATVHALDKASLDALYKELTQYPDIKMVL